MRHDLYMKEREKERERLTERGCERERENKIREFKEKLNLKIF